MRQILATMALLLLAACSGGTSGTTAAATTTTGGGSASSTTSSSSGGTVTPATNTTPIVIDAGPAALNVGAGAYTATNIPYVTLTICAPGSTSNCQTIDHVLLDTGSIGLRLEASVLNSTLLSALAQQTDATGNAVGECYEYVDNYVFGSVRTADFTMAGESVASLPLQVIGDTSGGLGTVPHSCSSSGGSNMNTVQLLGANGIIGVGNFVTDCGSACVATNGSGGAIYYDCPASGCSAVTSRANNTSAPYEQVINPVAGFATDNNGVIVSLPAVAPAGAVTLTGTLYFGIGTQSNNALGSASVLPTTSNGYVTATYNKTVLASSFIDSGSNYYYFADSTITGCTQNGYSGFYCPATPLSLAPTLNGTNGNTISAAFTLYNAFTQPGATSNAVPGVGANPNSQSFSSPINNSFDFGLPFFYGRKVYTAIAGRQAGGVAGPYFAY
ncbi:DUF3443 family protein [Novosphingobium sp.]|uniref:DUF3443 family protein n=1 Tax=Novosphingobium sp. TaxID=1874826 RepID=UPI003B517D34